MCNGSKPEHQKVIVSLWTRVFTAPWTHLRGSGITRYSESVWTHLNDPTSQVNEANHGTYSLDIKYYTLVNGVNKLGV